MSSFTFYDSAIPVAQDALNSLEAILKKAQAHANSANFATAKLADDMLPLTFQVHMVTDTAQKVVARLSGTEPLETDRNLTTYDEMHARITQARDILSKADKELINSRVNEAVPVGMGPGKTVQMTSSTYFQGYAQPNLFFHLSVAYSILRKEGVELAKMDYLNSFILHRLPASA